MDLPTEKNKKLSDFVTDQLYQALKPLGFKRRDKHNLYRVLDESIQVINVQTHRFDKNSITVNMGIYYPAVMKLLEKEAPTKIPHEMYCTLRSRIGYWLEHALDTWWTYVDKDKLDEYRSRFQTDKNVYTDQVELTQNIVKAVSQKGIKFFEKFQSLEDFKTHFDDIKSEPNKYVMSLLQEDIQKILQLK